MRGYRLTKLGKVVLFSLLFLFILSTAYTVKAIIYKLDNNNGMDSASNTDGQITQSNLSVIDKVTIPYSNKISIATDMYISRLKGTKLTIYFESDDASIADQYYDELDMFANIADILEDFKIEIAGNCATVYTNVDDNRTNIISYNLSLSRAESVSSYLKKKGIKTDRIITIGNGSNNPVNSNHTEEERKYNRRVEISFKSIK